MWRWRAWEEGTEEARKALRATTVNQSGSEE
jgi:hypothetical protein